MPLLTLMFKVDIRNAIGASLVSVIATSIVIQPIVMACIQTMRRTTSRESASAVEDIDLL